MRRLQEVLPLTDRSRAFPSSCQECVGQHEEALRRNHAELLDRLTALVQAHPGVTTGDLVALLPDSGSTKGEINVLLHRHTERFASIHLPPDWFRWYARGHRLTLAKGHGKPRTSPRSSRQVLDLCPWQREALATWRKHGHRGLIAAVTGTGKTHLGLAAAREELDRRGRVLVLVPTRELQDQWYERLRTRIRGYHIARLGGGARTECVNSLFAGWARAAAKQSPRPP